MLPRGSARGTDPQWHRGLASVRAANGDENVLRERNNLPRFTNPTQYTTSVITGVELSIGKMFLGKRRIARSRLKAKRLVIRLGRG